LVINYLWFRLT